jgi:carbon-monoxide dehydrogenase small subunit
VNGERVDLDVPPNETLLDTLRQRLGLIGSKEVCRTGDCGACTVIVDDDAVHSCLILTVEVDGSEILTIEGLTKDGTLHPLQEAFIEEDAVHCGYCTPGMIMANLALLREKPDPTAEDVKEAIRGNICRCGTYFNVINAVLKASKRMKKG